MGAAEQGPQAAATVAGGAQEGVQRAVQAARQAAGDTVEATREATEVGGLVAAQQLPESLYADLRACQSRQPPAAEHLCCLPVCRPPWAVLPRGTTRASKKPAQCWSQPNRRWGSRLLPQPTPSVSKAALRPPPICGNILIAAATNTLCRRCGERCQGRCQVCCPGRLRRSCWRRRHS